MKIVLFVCTGNTCRSPMAKAIMDARLRERGLSGRIRADSAGLMSFEGDSMTAGAQEALDELGVPYGRHAAKRLNCALVESADLVLTMEARHTAEVERLCPRAQGRVFALTDYAGQSGDIRDPYGKPLAAYICAAQEIQSAVDRVLDRLEGKE